MVLCIYAIAISAIAIKFIISSIKWKIATRALTLFCKEKFREPTEEEIADCSKRATDNTVKIK